MTDTQSSVKRSAGKSAIAHKRRSTGSLAKSCLTQVRKPVRPNQPFPFLRLPGELRNMICHLALKHPNAIEVRAKYYFGFRRCPRTARIVPGTTKLDINILRVSRQVYAEATPVFYGNNTFHITGSYGGGCATILLDFLTDIDRSVKYIRRLELGHVYNMKTTISALHLLKKAKNFDRIKFDHFDCLQYGSKYNKVAMLLPWLRALHQARVQAGRTFSLQRVLEIEIDANLRKSHFESEADFADRRVLAKTWYDDQMGMLELVL